MSMPPLARDAFVRGIVPELSVDALEALLRACERDDERLKQHHIVWPLSGPVEFACAIGFAGWQGAGLEQAEQVENFFHALCFEADLRLGQFGACRPFVDWFDLEPRGEVLRELALVLREVLAAPVAIRQHLEARLEATTYA